MTRFNVGGFGVSGIIGGASSGNIVGPYPPPPGFKWEAVREVEAPQPEVYENGAVPPRVIELIKVT